MAKEEGEFKYESLQDSDSIVKYLSALAEGFESGTLRFQAGEREMVLEPRGLLKFDLEAQRKGGRVKIALKLSWKQEEAAKQATESALVIQTADAKADAPALVVENG